MDNNLENEVVLEQWENVANNYSINQRTAFNNLTNWEILKNLLGDIRNKKVLDAGCGDGFFTNELKMLGADISGCDGSNNFIKIAQNDFDGIDFKVCDLTKKLPYKSNEFDIVVNSLTLMDIEEIEPFFNECHRILKPNGKLVFSIVHPCFFQADWEKDSEGNRLYKKVVNYYNQNKQILNFWGETTHYHRPLDYYSRVIKNSGFYIEELLENPKDLDNFTSIKPHQKRVPLFLAFSCVKHN